MKRLYLYLLICLSAIMSTAFAVFVNTGNNLSALLAGIGAVLFIEYGVEKSVTLKNRKYIKAVNSTSLTFVEALIIGGFLASHELPAVVIAGGLSSLVFLKSLKSNAENYTKDDIDTKFGRRGRLAIVLAATGLSIINSYYILIGAVLLTGSMIFDAGQIILSLKSRENSSKLKERILSR